MPFALVSVRFCGMKLRITEYLINCCMTITEYIYPVLSMGSILHLLDPVRKTIKSFKLL